MRLVVGKDARAAEYIGVVIVTTLSVGSTSAVMTILLAPVPPCTVSTMSAVAALNSEALTVIALMQLAPRLYAQ
ncbi:MAG: hypothetical protein A2Y38_01815 [Spirochaetes bacterium GWB1_59_5]|nr:MAG: hypothetical protein A2Y38_01815 [Spirochaetes bacterium GWB1_59_5]